MKIPKYIPLFFFFGMTLTIGAIIILSNQSESSTEDEKSDLTQSEEIDYYNKEWKVRLRVLPQDAQVSVEGLFENKVFYRGRETLDLKPGKYRVTVQAPNFQLEERIVKVVAADKTESFALSPLNERLRFNFLTSDGFHKLPYPVSEYKVFINNKRYFMSEDFITGLPIGAYDLRIEHPEQGVWKDQIVVSDKSMVINISFVPDVFDSSNVASN